MGASQSTTSFRGQSVGFPSSYYVATVHKRFVKPRVVTLALRDQFWTTPSDHEFVIRDIRTNQAMFKVGAISEDDAREPHRRRLLLDAYGVPVVGMERHDMPPRSAQYTVIPGGTTSQAALCTFHTRMLGPTEPSLQLEFTDPISGKPMILGTRGDWKQRDAVITITSDPRGKDTVYCAARIYRTDASSTEGTFHMDVARGVDLSLVLLLAAALEEQATKHEETWSKDSSSCLAGPMAGLIANQSSIRGPGLCVAFPIRQPISKKLTKRR